MEAIFNSQQSIIKSFERENINFKKDPASRKTAEYIVKKLERLDKLWEDFRFNHEQLLTFKDGSHEYFMKNMYEQTLKYYNVTRDMIAKYTIPKPVDSREVREYTDDISKLEGLISQQRTNFRAFNRQTQYCDVDGIEEKWELEDELRIIQARWECIDKLHWQIDNLLVESDPIYEDEYNEHELQYREIKRALNRKLSSTAHIKESTPKMDIPTFSGNFTEWPTFFDLYKETIHQNPTLSKSQKMQHLKSKVKGDAGRLIQHLHISADNYDTAWDILCQRYYNKQELFTKQIEVFLNQPNIQKQTSYEIRKLHDISKECLHAIQNLGIDTSTWSPMLVHLLSKKLDIETYRDYKEHRKNPRELAKTDEFFSFLELKFIALEPIRKRDDMTAQKVSKYFTKNIKNESKYQNSSRNFNISRAYYTNFKRDKCPLCNLDHALHQCKRFASMSTEMKLNSIAKHNICQNCLYRHEKGICNSTKRCKICNKAHNSLIHEAFSDQPMPSTSNTSASRVISKNANHVDSDNDEMLLTTVQIKVRAADDTYMTFRALLDQGSQITLITENAAQLLGLRRQHINASVCGVGVAPKKGKGRITLTCKSIYDDYEFETDALIMTKVINNLPNTSFAHKRYPYLQSIQLADPEYHISKPIDILLDVKVYSEIIMQGLLRGLPQQPIAQQTRLGWIVSGNIKLPSFNCHVVINKEEDMSRFWEMEEVSEKTTLTEREQWCEDFFISTTKRLPNGKYEVRLPMIENFEQHLGPSKPKAVAQLKHLETRLAKDKQLYDNYHTFMEEYIALGHMKKCITSRNPHCFLPHHDIHKEDSTTTKLRVVFNASSKTKSGYSLNDLMECGPKLQNDIQEILLNWRTYRYVYVADCEKMYRMILVDEDDQHLQKIVWRSGSSIAEYQLCTLTYGTKAAPFLALRTLKKIAEDAKERYRLAAKVVLKNVYVDDLMAGNNIADMAKQTQIQLIDMLKCAGINLRKWSSNTPELLNHLNPDQLNTTSIDFKCAKSTKTLGLKWQPTTDSFTFENKINYNTNDKVYTKRMMLSDMSKLFDPLGWLAPITIKTKILFKKVWNTGISWDDPVQEDIKQEWIKLRNDLQNIAKFDIPRWIGNTEKSIQLHGFSDASEKAMACAVYVRTINDNDKIILTLLAAKTKLAPAKKTITLPRLELCAAVLLTKLINKIRSSISENVTIDVFGWTDSMVVLGWLQGDQSRWKAFVANRVRDIVEIIPVTKWRHVKSEENAADCATRGLYPTQLLDNKLWWNGPAWLEYDLPVETPKIEPPNLEKKSVKSACVTQLITPSTIIEILNKHSSLTRVIRIICWISRFIQRVRGDNDIVSNKHLTANEMRYALHTIVKTVQALYFPEVITTLMQNKPISSKSSLLTLNPFLDKNEILRVGGRLQYSSLTHDRKHPIILPNNSHLTRLIIDEAHRSTLHGGATLTLAYTRYKYWIISGNRAVKKQIRQCIQCRRHNPQNSQQIMANLPKARVTPSRPFTHTGVDFTGFVDIKANKGRGIKTLKGYIAVFVCFATKAMHLELVTDLSSASFLAAFKRFCARRGMPKHMYSDNGTNFVGASKILNKQYQEALDVINTDFLDDINNLGVTWHFNAPAWPSAGGLWEAGVKSVKHHLKRIIGEQKLTFDEFYTLLAQIEACVNSRPLYALTENIEDNALTPAHFLVGGPLLSAPLEDLKEPTHPLTRWQLVQKMHISFWNKWSKEYLHHLQTRSKWQHSKVNMKINDIVLVNEDNMPPSKWALGRITELHAGKDGCVRVVTLQTKNGSLKRPILKLTPLPVCQDADTTLPKQNEGRKDSNKTSQTRIRSQRNRKQPKFYVALLTLLMTFIVPTLQQSINITRFNTSNTLYFDKIADLRIVQDQWKMVVYYNMTNYWQNMADIQKYVNHLKILSNDEITFMPIISQFEHELNEINYYNVLLQAKHDIREKRGLVNGIGNIANSLFGVLDDQFAQKYENDIRMIKCSENHLVRMIRNQTSIIEAENSILKRNEAIMNRHFHYINEHMKNITSSIDEVRLTETRQMKALSILSTALSIDVILSNLRRVQETLIDIITNIHHGQFDMHIISPYELRKQLDLISGRLQGELVTPVDNGRDLYQFLQVRAQVTKAYLIREIRIPLLSQNQFELSRIISLPLKKDQKRIYNVPLTPYIAINMKKDMVIPMTENDIQTCKRYQNNRLICHESMPILNVHFDKSICAMNLYNNDNNTFCRAELKQCYDSWIKLQAPGAWLYSCCRECRVRVLCPAGLDTKQLQGNGLINIGQGCLVKGDTFIIQAHHDYSNQLFLQQHIDVPEIQREMFTLNDMINSSFHDNLIEKNVENHDELYESIKQQIEVLKAQSLPEIDNEGARHYTIIYSILGPLVMFIGAYAILKLVKRWIRLRDRSRAQQQGTQGVDLERSRSRNSVASAANDSGVSARHTTLSANREVSVSKLSVDRATSPIMNSTVKFDNLPIP